MMYITSKVTGNKKATITMATEKRLQELMNREHQSNEAKFLAWALEEYKCECGCGGASIKEIRKYAEQEDWLRDEFGFDTEGYMEDTARAMNNRFHDYMAYWCRLCHSSLSIKSFNKLVKAVYDMTDEYGYVIYPEEVEEEPEATAETVESVEETTVSETETVEETAEQETELNAEVAQVEAEQTEENNIPHTVNRGRKSKGDISMNNFESDKYNSPFAVRFRELCKDTATAAKLRQYLGVTSQTISQFKLGTTLPKTENLIRIADFFNVSVDYLLGRTNTASQDVAIQAVCSTTGLSQAAVEKLALWTSDDDKRKLWADYLSYYITSPDFEKALEYINKAHNCYNGDLNEDVIVKLWQVSRKIEVVTESLIELEEIPKTGYFDTS